MMVRSPHKQPDYRWASEVCGDVCDWNPRLVRVDGIVHLAGVVAHTQDQLVVDAMRRTNVDGTMHMMRLAKRYGCPILIASTSGVVACSATPTIPPHDAPYCTKDIENFPYYQTKVEAEQQAISFANEHGVQLIVLRFPMLIGPGEKHPLRSLRVINSLRRGSYPLLLNGGVSLVDVRDVAKQIVHCVQGWVDGNLIKAGVVSHLTVVGANTTLKDLATRMAAYYDIPSGDAYWSVPTTIALRIADWLEWAGINFGAHVTPMNLRMGSLFWWCESQNSNFSPRDLNETLRDTIEYLQLP